MIDIINFAAMIPDKIQDIIEVTKQCWAIEGRPLFTVSLKPVDHPGLDETTLQFLATIGFPEDAAPGLDFTDLLAGKLFTHAQLYQRPDFPALDKYLVIGATGEGNPLCIDTANGAVICVDHDHGFESIPVNASLVYFNYCLVMFGVMYERKGTQSTDDVAELRALVLSTDPGCLEPGSFWEDELLKLEREADR